jgi:ABC-2 type transport system permease protein
MVRPIVAIALKELLAMLQAPRGVAAVLVPPLLQLFVFGYAGTFDVKRVPMAVMNEDLGPKGRELTARFSGSPFFDIVSSLSQIREIGPLVDRGAVVLVLHIGQRFSADLAGSGPADVQVIVDGRALNTALVAQRNAAAVIAEFNQQHIAAAGLPRHAAITVTRAWFNPNLLSHWYVIPGLLAKVLLIVTLTTTALSITRERELGTFERLLTAPLTPLQILVGKAVPALAIGLVQSFTLSALAILWFDVPFRGAFVLLAASFAAMLLAGIGLGLMISTIARTQPQAIIGAFLVMVPAIMLSGFATPISSMPDWIQALTIVNPLRYFIVIVRSLFLRGSGLEFVWPQLWPMLLIAFVTLGIAYWMIRRRLN